MRKFGIEIETLAPRGMYQNAAMTKAAQVITEAGFTCNVEGYNHHTRADWKVVPDASVDHGFEVVSPVLEGEEGLEQVRKVMDALVAMGCKVDKTCGLHVHIDGAGLGMRQIRNLCKFYWRFERQIDAFMPESRRNNQYCRSLRRNWGMRDEAQMEAAFDRCATVRDLINVLGTRYMKINLESWMRHGTVEFRQHSGTLDATKAINWVRFVQAMVAKMERAAYVVKNPEAEVNYTVAYAVRYLTGDAQLVKYYTARAKKLARRATAAMAA